MRYEKLPIVFVSGGAIKESIPDEAWEKIISMQEGSDADVSD